MRVFLLTFCDFMIDRLDEHRARKGGRQLLVPDHFAWSYDHTLKCIGIAAVPAKYGKFLEFQDAGNRRSWNELEVALKLFRSVVEVLFDYDSKLSLPVFEDSMVSGLKEILTWESSDFVKHAKYITVYPMAKFLHNPLPKRPDTFTGHPLLFKGPLRRYLQNRIVSHNKNCARLFLGYLQGVKRGAAVVSKDFIANALEDHREAMTTSPSRFELFATNLSVTNYADRIFRNIPKSTPKLFEGSTSASFELPRSSGGARGQIFQEYLGEVDIDRNEYSRIIDGNSDDLIFMSELSPGRVKEIRSRIAPINLGDTKRALLDRPATRTARRIGLPENEKLFSKVSAVLEPLKVRLITKGETWAYYFSRFYQKDLWSYLQTFPQFVLTGRPLMSADLYDMLDREKTIGLDLGSESFFVSGDYKAATDNLNIYYTKAVFESALRRSGLLESDKNVLRQVIYEQTIVYPPRCEGDDDLSVDQENGQLMGSTLSFPILCVVNLIAYWWALEEYTGRSLNVRDLPVLVNGDDIGFRANNLLYSIWLDKIKLVGFSLSLGKNYCSQRYFTINSKMFFCKRNPLDGKFDFEEVGYLNVGLLQNTVVDRRTGALKPLWDNYNETMSGAVNKIFAHRRFFHYNDKALQSLTRDGEFNLFISPLLGGLGFKLHPELRPHVYATHFQMKLATWILNRLKSGITTDLPITEYFSSQISLSDSVIRSLSHKPETFRHLGTYKATDKFGPLRQNERIAVDKQTATPFMMEIPITDQPSLELSFPTNRLLKEFRRSSGWIRGRRTYKLNTLLTRSFRLIEVLSENSNNSLPVQRSCGELDSHALMAHYSSDISNCSCVTCSHNHH